MIRCFYSSILAFILLFPPFVAVAHGYFNEILVKVNDEIITQYDLDEEMKPIMAQIGNRELSAEEKKQLEGLRKQTLQRMVNDLLMSQEVKRYGIEIPESTIDDEIRRVQEQRGMTHEEFVDSVTKDGLSLDDFRAKLRGIIEKQELLGYMVHRKVLVTDSEIEAAYKANKDDYLLDRMVELGIILLPNDVSAIEVKKRIKDGELTFAEAVAKFSVGPGKDNGGSIGELDWQDIADDWKDSLEGVEQGGVGTPIVVQGKEALLSPIRIEEDRMVPLEDVRDSIFTNLMEAKRETIFEEYFDKLKQKSVIVYMQ